MNGFPSGFNWYDSTSQCVIYQVGAANKVGPMFQGSDASISNAFGFAPGQVMASNVMNALTSASGAGSGFPFSGSAQITGSLGLTGSQANLIQSAEQFIIKNAAAVTQSLFEVKGDGTAIFRARVGADGAPTAVVGGLYFTTSSAFIGIN